MSLIIEGTIVTGYTGELSGSLIIPDGITEIGSGAFGGAVINSVFVPSSVTVIRGGAFSSCTSLTTVSGCIGVTELEYSVFSDCSNLSSIPAFNTVTVVGGSCFQGTAITALNGFNSLVQTSFNMFFECTSLISVAGFNSLTILQQNTFSNCISLSSVTLPTTLTTIGNIVFYNCTSLTSLTIPASVTSLGSNPFSNSNPTLYFMGNKPTVTGNRVSSNNVNINVYYKTSTTGWDTWTTLNTTLIVWAESQVPCFLANASVLTPSGYKRIASLKVGDLVTTPAGTQVPVQRVKVTQVSAGPNTNPYIIPKGKFGAKLNLSISPNHRVATSHGMIEARNLGLQQKQMFDTFNYYNIELPYCENMIVAGVEVESLAPVRRITVPLQTFKAMIAKKYGSIDASVAQKILKTCKLLSNGHVECPVIKNTQ